MASQWLQEIILTKQFAHALLPSNRGRADTEISQPKRALQKNVSLDFGRVLGQDLAKADYTF